MIVKQYTLKPAKTELKPIILGRSYDDSIRILNLTDINYLEQYHDSGHKGIKLRAVLFDGSYWVIAIKDNKKLRSSLMNQVEQKGSLISHIGGVFNTKRLKAVRVEL